MGNWGDELDYEAQKLEDFKPKFTINFKKIFMYAGQVEESTLEVNDKHPKDSLMILWAGIMVGIAIFFVVAYNIFTFIALPFLGLYVWALVRVAKCWKGYHYNMVQFWLMTAVTVVASFALSRVIQWLIGYLRTM